MVLITAPKTKGAHLTSLSGTSAYLRPGETRRLPQSFANEAVRRGCAVVPEDGDSQEAPEPHMSDEERKSRIYDAVEGMVVNADPADFTVTNKPKKARVWHLVGFQVTAAEIDEAYDAVVRGSE